MPPTTVPATPTGIDVMTAARRVLDTRYQSTEYDMHRVVWTGARQTFPHHNAPRLATAVAETLDMINEYVWITTHHSLADLAEGTATADYGRFLGRVLDAAARHYQAELADEDTKNGAPRRTPRHTKVFQPDTTPA